MNSMIASAYGKKIKNMSYSVSFSSHFFADKQCIIWLMKKNMHRNHKMKIGNPNRYRR